MFGRAEGRVIWIELLTESVVTVVTAIETTEIQSI